MKKQKIFSLYTKEEIDSAHFLKNYNGKCSNLHGHRWKIEFYIKGEKLDKQNMLIDFTELKEVIRALDHKLINEVIKENNPTAEIIGAYLLDVLSNKYPELSIKIRVWETPDNSVEVEYVH